MFLLRAYFMENHEACYIGLSPNGYRFHLTECKAALQLKFMRCIFRKSVQNCNKFACFHSKKAPVTKLVTS